MKALTSRHTWKDKLPRPQVPAALRPFDPIGEPLEKEPIQKILYVGQNGKAICRNMVDLDYLGLSMNTAFKAYCWLQNMSASHTWSERMGIPCDDLPDAIICDLQLPDGGAIDLYQRLQNDPVLGSIPFLVIAADASAEDKKRAFEAHVDDLYPLTVEPAQLHSRISFLKKFKSKVLALKASRQKQPEFRIAWHKRMTDLFLSSILLLLFSPLILLIAILIKLESKGPVLYVSKRAGAGYQIFDFYKFRSMRCGADAELEALAHLNQYAQVPAQPHLIVPELCIECIVNGQQCSDPVILNGRKVCEKEYLRALEKSGQTSSSFIKIDNDPRITRIGRFLRNTSLDELPQLINVLKGDMSLVGNRPLPLYEAERLTTDQWAKRFLAPAGITGLWQVTYRGKSAMSADERKQLDVTYADNAGFFNDLKILLRTIPALFQRQSV